MTKLAIMDLNRQYKNIILKDIIIYYKNIISKYFFIKYFNKIIILMNVFNMRLHRQKQFF